MCRQPLELLSANGWSEELGQVTAAAFALAHTAFWRLGPALAASLRFGVLMVAAPWRHDVFAIAIAHTGLLLMGLLAV